MKSNLWLYFYLLGLLVPTYTYAVAGADWYFLIRNTSGHSIEIAQQTAVCETIQTSLPLSIGPLDSRIIKVTETSKPGHKCTLAREKKFAFTINGLAVTAYSCYNRKSDSDKDCYVRDANHLHNIQVTTRNNYNLSVAIRGRSPTVEKRYVVLDYKYGDISLPIWCTATVNPTNSQCFRDNNYDYLTYHKGNPEAMFDELVKNIDNSPHKINLLRT